MLIDQGNTEIKLAVDFSRLRIGSSLKVVGTIVNPILFEIPIVGDPDETNDAHWQQMTTGSTAWQLDADNLILIVDGSLGLLRLNKPAGDNVGVRNKW